MENKIRVVLADDHACVRMGVKYLLEQITHVSVVGEAADTQALAELLDSCACDVVVSDLGMPGIDGESNAIQFLRRLLHHAPHLPVVVLTMIHQASILMGLLQHGIAGIVDKRDITASLVHAIDAAVTGQGYLSNHARAAIAEAGVPQPRAGVMSAREWKVFTMYVSGMTIGQIAVKLNRSAKTISTQKRNAMRKLGLETEADVIDYACQIGLT
ncbi:response regulator transcription factor [Paraburkholderia sp. LEh10]|jgi:two-component system capsular synthesis response regulator RcsB|uniref:response regulator transcription factor n=1 Tax=Paraburkholderia sp. LEh10 TaxID=2821353 RepID=UPI001AE3CA3E|nr:response regulator transcription factor [Paraburkholderia sp. LEh10]MBP0588929.1 response regulator transcription factor [Paraburkholderia sp. LEh10]